MRWRYELKYLIDEATCRRVQGIVADVLAGDEVASDGVAGRRGQLRPEDGQEVARVQAITHLTAFAVEADVLEGRFAEP